MNIRGALAAIVIIFLGAPVHAHTLNPEVVQKIAGTPPPVATSTDPRGEERTFASFPEWYIVYSALEYAEFVKGGRLPSEFPYFKATRQYWDSLDHVYAALQGKEIDPNTKTVLNFIGWSFTFENIVIGIYENTVGRLTEATNLLQKSNADLYIDKVSAEYGDFLLHTPWYAFPYFEKLPDLWRNALADRSIRSIERGLVFALGYTIKGLYGAIIEKVSQSSLGVAMLETTFTLYGISESSLAEIESVRIEAVHTDGHIQAASPRYRAFTPVVEAIVERGGIFEDIQGNRLIMMSVIAPSEDCIEKNSDIAFMMPIITGSTARIALTTPVQNLSETVRHVNSCGHTLEHIYDY